MQQNNSNNMREWLSPLLHVTNNPISLLGVVLVTAATVFWLYMFPVGAAGETSNPYIGIALYIILPGVFFAGLSLIPLGAWFRKRRDRQSGHTPGSYPPINWANADFRRLALFIVGATFVNVALASVFGYDAVSYMDSVTFCGKTCHQVMEPEYAAYQNSPHSRVECVKCHIGPGASWFVKSKLSGASQLLAVTFNTYERPIPTPVRNLRPARETCETCHWPQKFEEDRLRIIPKFSDDETNTQTKTVLLMLIGGGGRLGGIHGVHMGPGVKIRYWPSDESRQTIPRVEYTGRGKTSIYTAADVKPEVLKNLKTERLMDCMDCHNRPTHTFDLPDGAIDKAIATGQISRSLPFVKKKGLEILKASYSSNQEAAHRIPVTLEQYYRDSYPAISQQHRDEIARAGRTLSAIYNRNVFPAMKVAWGSYPNNLGHTDFPGCFRCHDDNHASADGSVKITQDCNACHKLLAMDEANPKVLSDLGVQ